jgi:hypothetical protein
MNKSDLTLRDFFGSVNFELRADELDQLAEQPATKEAAAAIAQDAALSQRELADRLGQTLGHLFDLGLPDLLINAWFKARELRKYADPKQYTPGEINEVELAQHEISSKHKPKLELQLNRKKLYEFAFDAALELEISGAVLLIQDGKIKEMRALTGKGSCQLKYGEHEIWKRESEEYKLPGVVSFGAGIAIPPPDSA